MPSFKIRSYEKELLDGENIPFPDIKKNMEELDRINYYLGGHRITLKGIKALVSRRSNRVVNIVEVGCGGGNNLKVIKEWASKKGLKVQLTGVDINSECVAYAKSKTENRGIDFLCNDYAQTKFSEQPDIIFSSLFCHHFTDEQLIAQLQWMKENAKTGFFINDLHRHPIAYYSIKTLTHLFSKSRLVKWDAPLSVHRGFTKNDWNMLLDKANIKAYSCRWQWAFRWLIICST